MASRSRGMQLQSISSISARGFHVRCFPYAITSDLKRKCQFSFGGTMRFCNLVFLRFLNRHFQSNRMSTQKFLYGATGLREAWNSDRLKLLKMVSALTYYNNMDDVIEQERLRDESFDLNGMKEEFDFALANARFPCITVGDSSPVKLYNEVPLENSQLTLLLTEGRRNFPDTATRKQAQETNEVSAIEFNDACQFLRPQLPTISCNEHNFSTLLHDSPAVNVDSGAELVQFSGNKTCLIAESKPQNTEVYLESTLDSTVKIIPDTTHRQCRRLEECGFHTVRKLLHHFPRTYADPENAPGEIDDGAYKIFVGMISSSRALRASSSLSFLDVVVCCESFDDDGICKKNIYLHLKKFFSGVRFTRQPFLRSLQSKYELGARVCVCGKVKKMRSQDHYEMREYNIDLLKEEEQNLQVDKRPYPLYPSKTGLKPSFLKDTISRALKILSGDIDPIPKDILEELNLPNLLDAYLGIHRPNNLNEADLARRRLNFDEFFYMQLGRLFQMLDSLGTQIEKEDLLYKFKCNRFNTTPVEEWSTLTKSFLEVLPYSLTPSQLNAVSEIIWDLKRPVPMNRLLQGDVGCGKTVVAFLACLEVIASGFQAALMVPTELVAIQHYELLSSLLENMNEHCRPSIALLTGSTPSRQSKMILKSLQTGDINMVIGTHSLIADKVEFSDLRFTVIDEQHRFGVIQRGRFNSKLYSTSPWLRMGNSGLDNATENKVYMAPHVLTMSATPIPRTLALAIYGDVSLTQITDLPPGRTSVETTVLEGNEIGFENVFQMMRDELLSGGKVYLVYPIIEESTQLPQLHAAKRDLASISSKFDSYTCGLLHGRMKSEEKYEALKKFKSGETQVLLATQVIEIGVDVPDASMMVVMNAERFGIAQLHQLRGRVGRGMRKSKCVFFSSNSGALNRLKLLEQSSNGFNLAIADLLVRGPGNLLGKKQSGHLPDFPIARLELDGNILREAHLAALKILSTSHDLSSFPKLRVELSMRKPLCILGD
ncbi:ATP-dependent DNA helicase homolog RECG, chloroplastic isoform X2 [Phalaenopsis equestris]|uniref:ATP-dependent DNA helicase homolog RECG, chloroplastic isoform X2 n=1 Tax=Phalaenopsis equestris TaxID=78828 RepID=UPI0009E2FC28|nr:ATP-dependent DNA helicase homolog RECG, chloroplastic isoform X2 [Phalaenopsis equestris]